MTRDDLKDKSWYEEFCRGKADVYFERFKWNGFNEFGELMTNHKFYGRFREFEYILICHMDAFVFYDELERWCAYGYDYIGSFIYNRFWTGRRSLTHKLMGFKTPEYYSNGGFALKRVTGFYNVTSRFRYYINLYHWIRRLRKRGFLDDIFTCELFPNLSSKFSVAPKSLSQQFGAAYEGWEENDLPFANSEHNALIFGCHGWIQYNQKFWLPYIRKCGYNV